MAMYNWSPCAYIVHTHGFRVYTGSCFSSLYIPTDTIYTFLYKCITYVNSNLDTVGLCKHNCNACTVWCNQIGTVFVRCLGAALTWHIGMKAAFYTKNLKRKSFGICIMNILNFQTDWCKCIFKEIQHITVRK